MIKRKAVFSEPTCTGGTLAVTIPGYARKSTAWTDDTQDITLELDVAAVLSGTVRFGDSPVNIGFVSLSGETMHFGANLSDSNGAFTFDQLPAGEYELTVMDSDGETTHTQQINIKQGEQKTITVEITEPAESDPMRL